MGVIARAGVWLLETIFAFGLVGSIIVILLSGIEDIETALQKSELQSEEQQSAR